MSTLPLPLRHDLDASHPLRTGLALGVTVGTFYALCAVVWIVAPGPFMRFMNSLFHGMDFTVLLEPTGFSVGGFLAALVVLSVWAFLAGTFFAWLRRRLGA